MLGALEVGGTKILAACAASPGDPLIQTRIPTATPKESLAAIRAFFSGHKLQAFGVATFGPVQLHPGAADFGTILATPKPGWQGVSWPSALQGLAPHLAIDTDVGAAALAEGLLGASQDAQVHAYLTIGTGVGLGLVVDNQILHGSLHPEFGHVRVRRQDGDNSIGTCPFHGDCLEGLASGPAIAAAGGAPAEQLPLDSAAWQRAAHALGEALANLILTTMPERIVLGGGVSQAPGLVARVKTAVATALGDYLPNTAPITDRIVPPGLGTESGIRGALCLALRALGTQD